MNWEDLNDNEPGMNVHGSSERLCQSPGKDVCDETVTFSIQLTLSDFQTLIKTQHHDVMPAESNMGLLVHKMRYSSDLLPPEPAEVPCYNTNSLDARSHF